MHALPKNRLGSSASSRSPYGVPNRDRQRTAALEDRSESIGLGAFHPLVDKRDSVLKYASPLAFLAREPRFRTKRRVFRYPVPSQSGRGLPHSTTRSRFHTILRAP